MSDTESDIPNLIDRSVKRLFRDQPHAVLRLAGVQEATVQFEDANLNIPELRADHVYIVQEAGDPHPFVLYLEYQLKPNPKLPVKWGLTWLGLCDLLQRDVLLLVIYLERGKRATFPATYQKARKRLRTKLSFDTVRLWEHKDRIVSGEWPELAPLLVLCEAKPTERTLRQEVELIHSSGLPHEVQTELMGVAISVASRRFSRSVLKAIFEKELAMLDAEENLTELFFELGLAQKWLQNPRFSGEIQARAKAEGEAEGRAQGIAEGRAEGRAEGEAEGETKAKREMTLAILTRRFGELPEVLVKRIETADADWCQRLFDRAITASSLSELIESL